jgi:hypothetical protein
MPGRQVLAFQSQELSLLTTDSLIFTFEYLLLLLTVACNRPVHLGAALPGIGSHMLSGMLCKYW